MSSPLLPPGRRRRGPAARLVTAAVSVVLASVLVVTAAGVLAVGLLVREAGRGGAGSDASVATVTGPLVPPATGVPPEAVVPAPPAPPVQVDAAGVLARVDAAAAAAGGTVAVVVLDAEGRPLVTGPAADDVVPTASLAKLPVVGRLLVLAAFGLPLGDGDRALLERAIVQSDDDAMSVLWDRYDGAGLLTVVAAEAGLSATAPPAVRGEWGEATTTAADVATLLAGLDDTFGGGATATLLDWMRATSTTAADGFDQGYGLLAGTAGVAAKQGWMCCVDGRRQLHSAGVLPDQRVVVLLGDFPTATSWARARTALDAAATAVLGALG